ncbi:MAG: hypothetical protein WA880_12580, partial [Ornithinimicrobium sp.]
ISSWPSDLPPIEEALRRSGAEVTMITGPVDTPAESGTIHVYSHGRGYAVRFPGSMGDGAAVVDTMDHALVERMLLGQILGWEPGDERITYVGGDYSARWLCAAVDEGRAAVAVLIAPVTVDDFVAVNVNRGAMPRKSTWFVPKARAGLVLADLR